MASLTLRWLAQISAWNDGTASGSKEWVRFHSRGFRQDAVETVLAKGMTALFSDCADAFPLICFETGLNALHIAAYYGNSDFVNEMLKSVPASIRSEPPIYNHHVVKEFATEVLCSIQLIVVHVQFGFSTASPRYIWQPSLATIRWCECSSIRECRWTQPAPPWSVEQVLSRFADIGAHDFGYGKGDSLCSFEN